MRKLLLAYTLIVVQLAFLGSAKAEVSEPWTTWAGGGMLFYEKDEEQQPGQQYEIRQGYDLNKRWTAEAGFTGGPFYEGDGLFASDSYAGGENWSLGTTASLLYHLKENPAVELDRKGKIDPYAGVHTGIRWYKKELDDGFWVPNAGPQIGSSYYFTDRWIGRADYRLEVAGADTEFNHNVMFYVGYRWGAQDEVDGDAASRVEGELDRDLLKLQTIYFPFDSSELTPAAQEGLQNNAEWLKNNPEKKVVLEGHCDERGTNEYNMALGMRRAESAHEYLRSLGVTSDRMETISYGEERPAAPGSNEEAWAQNRRVECVVKD